MASLRVDATAAGYRQLLCWARRFPQRRWAIEGARGLGCHLAQWLVSQGETAFDAAPVGAADETVIFALLEERRANVAAQRVRAATAAAVLRKVRPMCAVERTRKTLAWDLVREIRSLDDRLGTINEQIVEALEAHPSRLVAVDGVGPVLAARLIGRCGRPSRFPNADAFASYAGTAPVEASSGDQIRHRLSRSGDRRLNSALHLVAVPQVRMTNSAGRRYYDRKITEGKTHKADMRCLKRKIADHLWQLMLADEHERDRTTAATAQAA